MAPLLSVLKYGFQFKALKLETLCLMFSEISFSISVVLSWFTFDRARLGAHRMRLRPQKLRRLIFIIEKP